MKRKSLIISIFVFFLIFGFVLGIDSAQLEIEKNKIPEIINEDPYPTTPDWISDDPHYSTGAGLADFNLDGWLDLVVSDGNDMAQGRVNVYYNDGEGYLPTTASWQSDDIGYNGHLDISDVNGDGWPDVAVSYLGTSSSFGPVARLYLNNNGVLSSEPDWNSEVIGNAFGVDFGDMNNDGRPDLAVATGWSYTPQYEYHNLVYLNEGGSLPSSASWQSDDTDTFLDAHWVDADYDGWLDLAFIGTFQETCIYRNLGGELETTASWYTTDSENQDGIMLTSGDVNLDGIRDLFATENIQIEGNGRFKQYNGLEDGFFETTHTWSYTEGYGSVVTLADVNCDNKLDLATGAWWDNTRIFLNDGTGLPTVPSWSSAGTSVVEEIVFGNVGPELIEKTYTEIFPAEEDCRLFYLSHQNIQKIDSVKVDDIELNPSDYTYSREHGWVTIKNAPTTAVEISHTYSRSLDMVISNWDANIGNYLYYNQICEEIYPDLECEGELRFENIAPGSTQTGSFIVKNIGDSETELNWEISDIPDWGNWTINPTNGTGLTPEGGNVTIEVVIVAPKDKNKIFTGNVEIINIDDPEDNCVIDVLLITPKDKPRFNAFFYRFFERFSNKLTFIGYLLELL